MNLKWKRILILFSIALNIGFVTYGIGHFVLKKQLRPYRGNTGVSAQSMEKTFYHRLDLSAAQHDRIDPLLGDHIARQQELKLVNRQARTDLISLLAVYKESDRARLTEIIDRLATIKKEREQLTAEHLLQVKAILDDRQAGRLFARLQKVVEKEKE